MASKKKIPSFEEELARLEEIADAMENGDAPLEELCARYDEGMKLAEQLKKRLEAASCRLQIVKQEKDGSLTVQDSDLTRAEAAAAVRAERGFEDEGDADEP